MMFDHMMKLEKIWTCTIMLTLLLPPLGIAYLAVYFQATPIAEASAITRAAPVTETVLAPLR